MATGPLSLATLTFIICFSSAVSLETSCDFLTFGQKLDFPCVGVLNGGYCCYGFIRQPYCCEEREHFINIFLWIAVLVGVICGIGGMVRCYCVRGRIIIW